MAEPFSEVVLPMLDTVTRIADPVELPTNEDMERLKRMVAGGKNYNDFIVELSKYGRSKICTTVWEDEPVAYRCNTCCRVPTMAMCVECFQPKQHQGHDFFMFKNTNIGGKCDCGDEELCDPKGFCSVAFAPRMVPHKSLLSYAETSLPSFVIKTLIMVRGIVLEDPPPNSILERLHRYLYPKETYKQTNAMELLMITMLKNFAEESVFLKEIIVDALLSKELFSIYFGHDKNWTRNKNQHPRILKILENFSEYKCLQATSLTPCIDLSFSMEDTIQDCMLDSFLLWSLKRRNYSKVFPLLLVLLSDKNFKHALAESYSKNYVYITLEMGPTMEEYLSDEQCLLPTSCQFLYWPSKAFELALKFNLLKAILFCLYFNLFNYNTETYEIPSSSCFGDPTFERRILFKDKNLDYFTDHVVPLENFIQFLSNKDIVYFLIENPDVMNLYIEIIKFNQGMDINVKTDFFHENRQEFDYFNAHNELCMIPTWIMIEHLMQDEESILDNNFSNALLQILVNWVALNPQEIFKFSFHIPLHRISSILISSEMKKGLLENYPSKLHTDFLIHAVQHPLRILAVSSEILIETWLSNGDQLFIQSKLYRSPNFSASTIDPDYFFIQFAAVQLDPDYFTQLLFESFLVPSLLRGEDVAIQYSHQRYFLLGNVLFIIAVLVSARVLAGKDEEILMRSEVITSLATREKSFQVVLQSLPYRGPNVQPSLNTDLNTVLDSVADLKPMKINEYYEPMDRTFALTTKVFMEEYDPVLARMRSVNSKDYDESVRNYIKRVRNEKLSKEDPWPPFRSPLEPHHPYLNGFTNFLHCISLHAYIFMSLYYCYKGLWPESTLQIAIHLLNMSFKFPYYEPDEECSNRAETSCLYRNCLVPFDYQYRILSDYGFYDFLTELNPQPYKNQGPERYFSCSSQKSSTVYGSEFASRPKHQLFSRIERLHTIGPEQDTVHDTILSLLLKLFTSLTKEIYKPPHMRGEGAVRYGSPGSMGVRIGGAEYFIGEVLDQLVEGSEEVFEEVEKYVLIETQNATDDDAKAERRKKKLQAKKDLLKKQMAAKRKNLLEKIEDDEPTDDPIEEQPKCVICTQPLVFNAENPVCQLSYVTRTNLLGHRASQRHTELSFQVENMFAYNFETLQELIPSMLSCQKEDCIWYDNVWIQTCGHLVHIDCYYRKIKQSMIFFNTDEMEKADLAKFFEREIACVICRQICNIPIPLADSIPLPPAPPKVQRLGRRIVPKYHIVEEIFREALPTPPFPATSAFLQHIMSITGIHMNHFNLFVSMFRNNLELHLMNKREIEEQKSERDDVKKVYKPTKYINLNSLYSLFRNLSRNNTMGEAFIVLRVFDPLYQADSLQENIALVDIKQVLTTTILFITDPSEEKVKNVICFFHNLFLMQTLAWLVISNERNKVKEVLKYKMLSNTQLRFIIEYMYRNLDNQIDIELIQMWNDEDEETFMGTFISRLKEFLKFCALLYVSVFMPNDELLRDIESMSMNSLYDLLLSNHNFERDHVSSIRCFGWEEETIDLYLNKFCLHISQITHNNSSFQMMVKLKLADWKPPRLFPLPMRYEDFLPYYKHFARGRMSEIDPREPPKLCLICGNVTLDETKHASFCCLGTGWFLTPHKNNSYGIWNGKKFSWPTPYTTVYGETSIATDRSLKLFLNDERYQAMQDMWLFNSFDRFIKHWPKTFL